LVLKLDPTRVPRERNSHYQKSSGIRPKTRTHSVAFEPFDIVVVSFPFTDRLATERRPLRVSSAYRLRLGFRPMRALRRAPE